MSLNLYRRHTQTCSKEYATNHRLFKPRTQRQRNADCLCPINAEGKLKDEFITNRSTKKIEWPEAEAVAFAWEKWGSTKPPQPQVLATVQYAVESFLASQGPSGRNIEVNTLDGFRVLLNKRLLPYAGLKEFSLLSVFDDLDVTTKFVESWTNLIDPAPLADSTKKTEIERLRAFFAYCMDRGWLKTNQAKKLKFSFKTEPKFGMSPNEEDRLFALLVRPDLHAFCLVMRWAGLRISDATTLDDTQLIERASGNGWAIKIQSTMKTKEAVYIPIPSFVEAALRQLPFRCERDGRRYWFWSGESEIEGTKNNWYAKIMTVVDKLTFLHSVTPHTFRHTFAISHLNAGVDIKLVSRWLSHASVTVTEKHYAHAIHGTLLASDEAFDQSLKRQRRVMTA